jgi:hypothetical protein
MGHYRLLGMIAAAGLAASGAGGVARAQQYPAALSGFNETGPLNSETGAILTPGTGTLSLDLDKTSQTATYSLTFSRGCVPFLLAGLRIGARSQGVLPLPRRSYGRSQGKARRRLLRL